MSDSNSPQASDAVLSERMQPPIASVVLGGLVGVQQQFASPIVEQRQAAVFQAGNYGEAGLALVIQALQDPSLIVQKAAYWALQHRPEPIAQQALRSYEVYRLFTCLFTLQGHQQGITAVALSPDEKTIVSAGRDQMLRVWDIPTQAEVMTIPEAEFVYGIAISPDNRKFTIKTGERRFKAWDMRYEQQIDVEDLPTRGIASVTVAKGAAKGATKANSAISPTVQPQRNGKYLISGSQNLIRVWNLAKGEEAAVLRGHTSLVTAVAVAANRLIVSGSEDKTLRVWGIR
jgi:hypothetical protein